MRTNPRFPTTSREPSLNKRQLCTARGTTMKNFLLNFWKRLCVNLFFTRRNKMLSRLDGFMLYSKVGVEFYSTSKLLYANLKNKARTNQSKT